MYAALSLRARRRALGLTIVDVALSCGVPARAIAEIEHGLRRPDEIEWLALARFFGLAEATPASSAHTHNAAGQAGRAARAMVVAAVLGGALQSASPPPLAPTAAGTLAELRAASAAAVAVSAGRLKPNHAGASGLAALAAALRPPVERRPPSESVDYLAPHGDQRLLASPSEPVAGEPSVEEQAEPLLPLQVSAAFLPLPPAGEFRHNVAAALDANGGALRQIVLPPGATWSFNRSVGDPRLLSLAWIGGVYGGGWCDLASRYVTALRPLLPPESIRFARHVDTAGFGLAGVPDDDAVAIWNTNGDGAEQDLVVRNDGQRTLVLEAGLDPDGVTIQVSIL